MPELDATTLEKIADLREISANWSDAVEVHELLKISWESGAIYYSVMQTDEVSSVALPEEITPVECRIVPRSSPAHFFEIETDSSLGDEKIDVEIWDGGALDASTNEYTGVGAFANLVEANGEGTPAEVFMWFPQVELLLSVWQGHLRNSEESDEYYWRGTIANGFRSPNLPLPSRAHYDECQAIFGGLLETQEEIDENDCPYNRHIGGDVGNLYDGEAFTSCPRKTFEQCTARLGDHLFHLSHQSQEITVLNNQSKGPQLYSISRGNESNLKDPVRVVMGIRRVRDMQVIAFRRDYNNNDPDHGFFNAYYEACEGPIQEFRATSVNGQAANPVHYAYRLGTKGQPLIDSTVNRLSDHAYSGTAYLRYNFGWVNPGEVGPDNMRATSIVFGLNDIRVYTDEDTYTEVITNNRAWHIARALCDKRWGFGLDYVRLGIDSWIESADWTGQRVVFVDPDGTPYEYWRAISDVELVSRTAQQQIEDMCSAGRLTRPFLFQGKIHVMPLRALTAEELDECPVFTDIVGTALTPNIVRENGRSTLSRSQESDLDIPNRVEATFHDHEKDWTETTAPVAEDVTQQLKAGRVLGDRSRRVVTKKYSLLGVVQKGHAVSLSYFYLWFGEFAEGGILNNLEISFKCWFLDALELHQGKVIKVVSRQLVRYGFEYFRIKRIKRLSNLTVEIVAQAHNNEALASFEADSSNEGDYEPPIPAQPVPCRLDFDAVTFANGLLRISITEC